MKLADYRRREELTQAQMAALIGVSDVAVHRYENGRVPDARVLQRIIDVTGGAVQANDFFAGAGAAA